VAVSAKERVRCRPGFTLVEMFVVVLVGMVLAVIALPPLARVRERRAVANARDAYVWTAAVARGLAIERGATVRLDLIPAANAAFVRVGEDTIQRVDFGTYGAVVQGSEANVTVCYSARGFASPGGCSENLPADIDFRRGDYVAGVRVKSLGDVELR